MGPHVGWLIFGAIGIFAGGVLFGIFFTSLFKEDREIDKMVAGLCHKRKDT